MQQHFHFDAIVIGSGPGGEGAAMGLVKQGARVAVIERYNNVGGVAPIGAPSLPKLCATPLAVLSSSTKTHFTATMPEPSVPLSLIF